MSGSESGTWGSAFDARWQELRERFVERLAERAAAIHESSQAIADGRAGDPDSELRHSRARHALYHEVHSLAGSGATFGFGELSRAARALEPYLDPRGPHCSRAQDTLCLSAIAELLCVLENELRRINPRATG